MHRKLRLTNGYKDNTPGPGSYLHFSEFGMWVPKNKTNDYNVRKRAKTAKNSVDNINNYFRKKMERAITEKNSDNRKKSMLSTLR